MPRFGSFSRWSNDLERLDCPTLPFSFFFSSPNSGTKHSLVSQVRKLVVKLSTIILIDWYQVEEIQVVADMQCLDNVFSWRWRKWKSFENKLKRRDICQKKIHFSVGYSKKWIFIFKIFCFPFISRWKIQGTSIA